MNNKLIYTTVIAASFVLAGFFLLNLRLPIAAVDGLIGYAAVICVAGVAALEYRLHRKRSFSK